MTNGRLSRRRVSREKRLSTAFNDEHEAGAKQNALRGCRLNLARYLGGLVGGLTNRRFVRMAVSTPARVKIGMGYGKRLVKEAFRRDLPRHILTRGKASLTPPIVDWVYPECEELLFSSELFQHSVIQRRIDKHTGGIRNHLPFLWGLLVTNAWIPRYQAQVGRANRQVAATGGRNCLPNIRPISNG